GGLPPGGRRRGSEGRSFSRRCREEEGAAAGPPGLERRGSIPTAAIAATGHVSATAAKDHVSATAAKEHVSADAVRLAATLNLEHITCYLQRSHWIFLMRLLPESVM